MWLCFLIRFSWLKDVCADCCIVLVYTNCWEPSSTVALPLSLLFASITLKSQTPVLLPHSWAAKKPLIRWPLEGCQVLCSLPPSLSRSWCREPWWGVCLNRLCVPLPTHVSCLWREWAEVGLTRLTRDLQSTSPRKFTIRKRRLPKEVRKRHWPCMLGRGPSK